MKRILASLAAAAAVLSPNLAFAFPVDTVWLPAPADNNWNNDANWDNTAPSTIFETGVFNTSLVTDIDVNASTTFAGMVFNPGADAFIIRYNGGFAGFNMTGSGIANNSGNPQMIINQGPAFSTINFTGASTVTGRNVWLVNDGPLTNTINFSNTASAGTANILNLGPVNGVNFFGDSTAGQAAITNVDPLSFVSFAFHNAGTPASLGSIDGVGGLLLGATDVTIGTNNRNAHFSGLVSGILGGTLTKVGDGTQVFSGINTMVGGIIIKDGTLAAGSEFALGVPLALLAGGNSVTVGGGTLRSSGGPRDINVFGNYTQKRSGSLWLGIDRGNHDMLNVSLNATLGGTLGIFSYGDFLPQVGNKFDIVKADDVDGRFNKLVDPFKGEYAFKLGLVYKDDKVTLVVLQDTFEQFAETPNQRSVAAALDQGADDRDVASLYRELNSIHGSNLPKVFDLIAPEELTAIWEIAIGSANTNTFHIQRHTDELRGGATGFDGGNFALANAPAVIASQAYPTRGGVSSADAKVMQEPKDIMTPAEDNRWSAFLSGAGEFIRLSDDSQAKGFDITTGGFTLGVDYRVTKNFAIGVFGGYAGTGADLVGDGRVLVNSGKLGLYATAFSGGLYGNAILSTGYSAYDTKREAFGGIAWGETEGWELNTLLGGGYDFQVRDLVFGPTLSAQYTMVGLDDFDEKGSRAPLTIESQDEESLRMRLGMRLRHVIRLGKFELHPGIRVEWQHEFLDDARSIDASIRGAGGTLFSVDGPELGRDSLLVGVTIGVPICETVSAYIGYDGQVARDNYSSHTVSGGMTVKF